MGSYHLDFQPHQAALAPVLMPKTGRQGLNPMKKSPGVLVRRCSRQTLSHTRATPWCFWGKARTTR